ncbi:MAG: glycosyltransferase [Candidatus Saccharibacteria bacterium]|nr:glycosyltransferase [Candidatus Saccharibacteria bacterium]
MRRVIYIVKDKDNAQFRYRVCNVVEAMEGSKSWRVGYCLLNEIGDIDELLGHVNLIVVARQTAKDDAVLNLINRAHRNNIKVLFDLDDLVFSYRYLAVLMRATNSKNIFYWLGYFWGIRRIAKKVDGFIATNDFLGRKLEQSFKKPCRVIPNSLNRRQIEISEDCLKRKSHDGFVIGYFSGSPTHAKDFQMVEPELVRFLENSDDVKLEVVGYMKFSSRMKKWIRKGRVKIRGVVDYLELQKLMARVDVNIAPLVISDFTNCKSELKFFEAAIVETVTIASPTYPFKEAIKDGENGFLARSGEWYGKLKCLYGNPEKNKKVVKYARECALKSYFGEEFLRRVEEAYDFFVDD